MSVINTNYLALVSQNNLNKSQSALGTAIERLSSGLRINSAKDDAAGQAIANRMNAQVQGLNQAARNANDGISAAQTTEGALNQINDNLNRIRVLTVQAENGSNSDDDLTSIQNEINQRLEEINRISDETEFNGRKVLASGSDLQIQVGANDGQKITIGMKKINTEELGLATFNVNQTGASANPAATSDSLTLAGFTNVGKVNGSDQFERTTTTTNTKAGASDIVSRMSANDTVTVAGVNNGLGVATGDTYTYDAASNSFSFGVNDVSSSDVANFLKPGVGEKTAATITLGGSPQEILIDSEGKISNKDNQALYLDTTGNLTLNGGGSLARATLDSLAARMTAQATPAPTATVTTPGANETNTVTFQNLAAGESVTVGGLTYTAGGGGALAAAVGAAFEAYDASTPASEFSGSLEGWSVTSIGGTDTVVFTSNAPGDVANISTSAMDAFTGPAGATVVRTAADATSTSTVVTFQTLAQNDEVTVGGVTLKVTDVGGMTAEEVATAFHGYFTGGTTGKGTFDPAGGDLSGFTIGAFNSGTDTTLTFNRDDAGALSGVSVAGANISESTTNGQGAVTARNEVTFTTLNAGEQFKIKAGANELTFTADANMDADAVAAAFASALASEGALDADDRFDGNWDFAGLDGWTVQASSGASITFENQDTSDTPNNTALTTATASAKPGPTPVVGAADAEVTEVTFGALTAGQAVTVNGMTLTANNAMTADEVADAFAQKGASSSFETAAATFTGSFDANFNIGAASGSTLSITAKTAGVSDGVTVSSPSAMGGGSIQVGGTTFTVDGNSFDVTGATIGADKLVTEAAGKAYSMNIAAGDSAGAYAVDVSGDVSRGGDTLYVSGTELTTDVTSETKETYFAHTNGNVTDAAGNRIYQDAQSDTGFSTKATTPGTRTENALDALDSAIAMVDAFRSDLGAIQNRFQSAIQNLTTTATNLAAAQSRIQDADYAVEVANMTRAQILQQAGTSVLAQANQIPQGVLSLLR